MARPEWLQCQNCLYYAPAGMGKPWGNCHYNPPSVLAGTKDDRFPFVDEDGFCSKWRDKETLLTFERMLDKRNGVE